MYLFPYTVMEGAFCTIIMGSLKYTIHELQHHLTSVASPTKKLARIILQNENWIRLKEKMKIECHNYLGLVLLGCISIKGNHRTIYVQQSNYIEIITPLHIALLVQYA